MGELLETSSVAERCVDKQERSEITCFAITLFGQVHSPCIHSLVSNDPPFPFRTRFRDRTNQFEREIKVVELDSQVESLVWVSSNLQSHLLEVYRNAIDRIQMKFPAPVVGVSTDLELPGT